MLLEKLASYSDNEVSVAVAKINWTGLELYIISNFIILLRKWEFRVLVHVNNNYCWISFLNKWLEWWKYLLSLLKTKLRISVSYPQLLEQKHWVTKHETFHLNSIICTIFLLLFKSVQRKKILSIILIHIHFSTILLCMYIFLSIISQTAFQRLISVNIKLAKSIFCWLMLLGSWTKARVILDLRTGCENLDGFFFETLLSSSWQYCLMLPILQMKYRIE